jgi:hypothetical protein
MTGPWLITPKLLEALPDVASLCTWGHGPPLTAHANTGAHGGCLVLLAGGLGRAVSE